MEVVLFLACLFCIPFAPLTLILLVIGLIPHLKKKKIRKTPDSKTDKENVE